jgi:hypothetical protein
VAFSHLRASQIPKIKAVDNYRNENNSFTTRISQNFRRHVRMARCRRERYVEARLGVASAFSYFVVFGGGVVLPTLPPLVAADRAQRDRPELW